MQTNKTENFTLFSFFPNYQNNKQLEERLTILSDLIVWKFDKIEKMTENIYRNINFFMFFIVKKYLKVFHIIFIKEPEKNNKSIFALEI